MNVRSFICSLTLLLVLPLHIKIAYAQVGPVVFDALIVDDNSSGNSTGNSDGIINCGEIVEFFVHIRNTGTEAALTVNGTLSAKLSIC